MNVTGTLSSVMSNQVMSGIFSWLSSWNSITLWNHLVFFDAPVDWCKMFWKMFAHHFRESLWLVQLNAIIVTLLKRYSFNFISTHFHINLFTHHLGRHHLTKRINLFENWKLFSICNVLPFKVLKVLHSIIFGLFWLQQWWHCHWQSWSLHWGLCVVAFLVVSTVWLRIKELVVISTFVRNDI